VFELQKNKRSTRIRIVYQRSFFILLAIFSPLYPSGCALAHRSEDQALKKILHRAPLLAPFLFVAACNTTTATSANADVATTGSVEAGRSFQRGGASWYGPGFHGRRTASGERFDSGAMTAAHRSLPFGTRVRVQHEGSGRSVVVRINDRGPFHGGRIIDLAAGPARALGIVSAGAAHVSLHRLD
jgi:rare lipoprotein A